VLLDPAQDALQLVARHVVDVHPGWLSLGCGLLGVSQLVRTRGWFTIVRAACPQARTIRARNVMAASMAGAGLNGVLPARSGDVVKLWLLHRRAPEDAPYAPLAATLVPEGVFEAVDGQGRGGRGAVVAVAGDDGSGSVGEGVPAFGAKAN